MSKHLYDIFSHWESYQGMWVISDTHFNDPDSKAFRGDSYPGDEELVKMINSCVGKNGMLLHLGDVGDLEYAKMLKGYKVLVMGNHDKGWTDYKRKQWTRTIAWEEASPDKSPNDYCIEASNLFPGDHVRQEEWQEKEFSKLRKHLLSKLKDDSDFAYLSEIQYSTHRPFMFWVAYYDNRLFDEVYQGPIMLNARLEASHEDEDLSTQPHKFNIHGHRHDLPHEYGEPRHLNFCAEAIGYKPVSLSALLRDGMLRDVPDIHRVTVDHAVERKARKGKHPV